MLRAARISYRSFSRGRRTNGPLSCKYDSGFDGPRRDLHACKKEIVERTIYVTAQGSRRRFCRGREIGKWAINSPPADFRPGNRSLSRGLFSNLSRSLGRIYNCNAVMINTLARDRCVARLKHLRGGDNAERNETSTLRTRRNVLTLVKGRERGAF